MLLNTRIRDSVCYVTHTCYITLGGVAQEDELADAAGVDAKIRSEDAWKLTLANLETLQVNSFVENCQHSCCGKLSTESGSSAGLKILHSTFSTTD